MNFNPVVAVQKFRMNIRQRILRIVELVGLELRGREIVKNILSESRLSLRGFGRLFEMSDRLRGLFHEQVSHPVQVLHGCENLARRIHVLEGCHALERGLIIAEAVKPVNLAILHVVLGCGLRIRGWRGRGAGQYRESESQEQCTARNQE